MKQKIITQQVPASNWFSLLTLLLAVISHVLASPKWNIAIFAWIAPVFLLYFFRLGATKKKLLWIFPALIIGSMLSSYDVAPFPVFVLIVLGIIESLKVILILLADRWIIKKSNYFLTTLFFPCAYVSLEFLNSKLGGGSWWSIANSQYSFAWLTQLASITGLWGISFLIYWFASVIIWAVKEYSFGRKYRQGLMAYGIVFFAVLSFGFVRYNYNVLKKQQQVKVAGLSAPLLDFMQSLYKDYCGKEIIINPKSSISSGVLQQVNQAQLPFIETADTTKFKNGYAALRKVNDSLFSLSQQAADQGAKIICWSEANTIAFRFDESGLIERGKNFALKNKVYLLMAMAVIDEGKITPGKKFIENKCLFFGPGGQVLNVFHKNNPVPMVENSAPGDGNIPVMETPYGRISTSICYDADFPTQMRQTGRNKTGVLLLPSGDWYAISPYHTYMAVFRGIENGCSIVRQASGGLSIATDYRGKTAASLDFYKEGTKMWVADIPVGHVSTMYTVIGDAFAYICIAFALGNLLYMLILLKVDTIQLTVDRDGYKVSCQP
jgi:apolipoprotein N-acyltransferase